MSSDAERPAPEAAAADASDPDRTPKPPPDSSWLRTEEVRGTGREEPPLPLEPKRRPRASGARRPE